MMKLIHTPAKPTLTARFKVGAKMIFTQHHFDGRADTSAYHLVKIAKVHRVSVDIEFKNGTIARLSGAELNDLDRADGGAYARLGAILSGR